MESAKRREMAYKFQEAELKKLSKLSFKELLAMPKRTELKSPENLDDFDFAIGIKRDEFGGLEVSVFHHHDNSDFVIPDYLKNAIGDIEISIGESRMNRWFNISSSNHIVWPSFSHDEDD